MSFSTTLRELRTVNKLSQAQIAYKLGIERSTVAHWESGKSSPNYEVISKLADIFGVSVDFLVGKTTVPFAELTTNFTFMKHSVPVYGRIPAGTPFEAIEERMEDLDIPNRFAKKKDLFGLKIEGESMNKIIPNGSIGLFEKCDTLETGEIGAIIVNGEDAQVKKFHRLTDSVLLEPVSHDNSFVPIIIKDGETEVKVIGKLLWVSIDF